MFEPRNPKRRQRPVPPRQDSRPARPRTPQWLGPAAWLLLVPAAQAQGSACEQVKSMLAARIEATGVRGYGLEIVPASDKVPPGAQAIGTCAGGANKIVYRRFAAAPPAAGEPAAAPPAPAAPTVAVAAPMPPAQRPAPAVAPSPAPVPPPVPTPVPAKAPAAVVPAQPASASAPAAPAAAAPTVEDRMRAIDAAVAQMAQAQTVDLPSAMTLGTAEKIRLSLDMADARGTPAAPPLAVVERIEARLTGANFRIAALTPEDQPAAAAGRSVWQWEAQPNEAGAHALRLAMSAVFRVEGAPVQRVVRSFDKTVEVRVGLAQRASEYAAGRWPWLLALLIVPAAVWLWRRRHGGYDEAGLPRGPRL